MANGKKRKKQTAAGFEAQRIGEIGERQLSLWACQVGLNASRPLKDADGWDITADIHHSENDEWGIPLAPTICRVQVKSSRRPITSVRLSISTALSMAQQPVPWFLVCFQILNNEAVSVRVRHIDAALIDTVLRASAAGKSAVRIPVGPKLTNFGAQAWHAAITDAIGSPSDYVVRKLSWRDCAGRDTTFSTIKFKTTDSSTETLVDFALGLAPRLAVSEFSIIEHRYGISKWKTETERATMVVDEIPVAGRAVLRAIGREHYSEITADVLLPFYFVPNPPREHLKIRFRHPNIDVVIHQHTKQTTIGFHWDDSIALDRLEELVSFVKTIFDTHTLEISVARDGTQLGTDTYHVPEIPLPNEFRHTLDAICSVTRFLRAIGVSSNTGVDVQKDILARPDLDLIRTLYGSGIVSWQSLCLPNTTTSPTVVVRLVRLGWHQRKVAVLVKMKGQFEEAGRVFTVSETAVVRIFPLAPPQNANRLLEDYADEIERQGATVTWILDDAA